ncbi:MAG: S1C family serine protease [Lacipirellulaceae bacterium]
MKTPSIALAPVVALVLALVGVAQAQRDSAPQDSPADRFRDAVQDVFERVWVPSSRYTDGPHTRQAFREVVADTRKATVEVRHKGRQVALGGIVGPDGWIVTKASLMEGDVTCRLADRRELPARLVGVDRECDLAMLKIDATGLATIDLRGGESVEPRMFVSTTAKRAGLAGDASGSPEQLDGQPAASPQPGDFVATVGLGREPAAIGVVSVGPRTIPRMAGILGIRMEETGIGGVLVGQVYPGTGAARAGVESGDLVLRIEGVAVESLEALKNQVQRYNPGDRIEVVVRRGERELRKRAVLSGTVRDFGVSRSQYQNSLGGELTERRFGFPSALQHDTVLSPRECGGPIVDLDGRVVGFNIARAGRTESYALPRAEVSERLVDLMSGRLAPRAESAL